MKTRTTLCLLALCVCTQGTVLHAQEAPTASLWQAQVARESAQLLASFHQFPLIAPATNSRGQPEFMSPGRMDPVVIDAVNYYGFRFKVPKRENAEDFVWAMILRTSGYGGMYLLSEEGKVLGLDNYYRISKTNYLRTSNLPPSRDDSLVIRSVSGNSLQEGKTYLVHWVMNGTSDQESLSFAFARLQPNAPDELPALEKVLGLVRASTSPVIVLNAPSPPGQSLDERLQAAFLQFPLLTPATDKKGHPAFQTLGVMDPVMVNTNTYYGFRFTVPKRKNAEDFVWGTIRPAGLVGWYILPEKGTMHGFENYRYMPKTNYVSTAKLLPRTQKQLTLQSLSGDSFVDGQTYLIWWELNVKAQPLSLVFTFAPLGPDGLHNQLPPMEKALGLVPAPGSVPPNP